MTEFGCSQGTGLMADGYRLSIENKMLLGYLPLVLVIILISVFSLLRLNDVNRINKSIVERDRVLLEAADKLKNNLLVQESYGRRYVILESQEMLEMFWHRSREFNDLVGQIQGSSDQDNLPVMQLEQLHEQFDDLYKNGFIHLVDSSSPLARAYDEKIKAKLDELMALIQAMTSEIKTTQNHKITATRDLGLKTFRALALLSGAGIMLGVGAALLITRNIARSIQKLKLATEKISEGDFDHMPDITAKDELGELAKSFSDMAQRLRQLEKMHIDANPLTRLPGGVAIENILKTRLEDQKPLALCLIDLDFFKAFNDRYGYARGNEVIKATAKIIESAVRAHARDDDFIGHIGGDDFAVITGPSQYVPLCNAIIRDFDQKILDFYDPSDRAGNCIKGKTRQGQEVKFPIMSISIAVVTNEAKKEMNHLEISEIAAELKEHAKSLPGSVFVTDRRGESG